MVPPPVGVSGTMTWSETALDVVVEEHVVVPMRDVVRLATDIYRPA